MNVEAAIVDVAGGDFRMCNVDLDRLASGEILVRIAGVGICHTDLIGQATAFGHPGPILLGHEGAGVVEAIGEGVERVSVGDHVILSFRSCGHCARCGADEPSYCQSFAALNFSGTRPDGSATVRRDNLPVSAAFFSQSSFASHAIAHASNAVVIDRDLPLRIMGPLGCGFQTGAGAIMRSLSCPEGSTIVIAGGGAVGLSAVMGAILQGCSRIVVVEPHPERRALARRFGATEVVDPVENPDIGAALLAILPGGFEFALDTVGRGDVIKSLLAALATRGTLGMVAVAQDSPPPEAMNDIVARGLTLRGIVEGDSDPQEFIPELISHYRAGRFPFDRLISFYPLEDIGQAIADQHRGCCVKPVLLPSESSK